MVPGTEIKENGEWRILWGEWQRTTKNDYHLGWIKSMVPTNTRPALTPEQDKAMLGKYAYQKNDVRQSVPIPPDDDTWEKDSDVVDKSWLMRKSKNRKKE